MSERRVWWINGGEDGGWFAEFHRATCEWVTGLGLDPSDLVPDAEVVERDGAFEFRAERVVRDPATGHPQFDPNDRDSLLTEPVNVQVAEGSWPARPATVDA